MPTGRYISKPSELEVLHGDEIVRMYCDELIGSALIAKRLPVSKKFCEALLKRRGLYKTANIPRRGGGRIAEVLPCGYTKTELREMEADFNREWSGVVDNYWTGINAARFGLDKSLSDGMARYWINHEQSKARSRASARRTWEKVKSDPERKERKLEQNRQWYRNNPVRRKELAKLWRATLSPERKREYARRGRKQPTSKVRHNLRARIRKIVRLESHSFNSLIGCTGKQLKQYIEAQFKRGMTWENYGSFWHIDHIQPLASFNLADRNHLILACNWMNLRPLPAKDNMEKSDSITQPQLHLALCI